ncbi:unnamed protein product [Caenorhabditis auriculariae]|uniref:Arrestin C-terminal-like domain-containing protein n=1 Tax=Caenorhabditis auriculariae TaxID=2777116 RepID=A0A8S1H811_9PELO|nr:unnamed protein product [Caenorhabditis auriculariae]
MKVEFFDVTLDRGIDEPYLGGETIKGVIEMVCVKRVRITGLIVRLTGVAETGWRSRQDELPYESRNTFMDERVDLTTYIADHCTDEFELLEGKHVVPFEGRIPLDVLSTVDRENHGNVRYTCTALMAIPEDGDTEVVAEKTFTVYSLLNLDAPYLRDKSTVTEEQEVTGCCSRRRGSISATLQIEEVGVMPGETSRISITVENKTKKRRRWRRKKQEGHECVLLTLCQQLDFVASNRYDPMLVDHKSITIAVETHGTCKTRAGAGPQTKEIEFSVPSNLPPTSIQANRLVTISYFFKLDLEHFDVVLPVVLGSVKTPGVVP